METLIVLLLLPGLFVGVVISLVLAFEALLIRRFRLRGALRGVTK